MLNYENVLYLSERNLRTLLSKVERYKAGEDTKCAIIKNANPLDPYCSTIDQVCVVAIPDEQYYTGRDPGRMLKQDEPVFFRDYKDDSLD
jgi:hypothetical protein